MEAVVDGYCYAEKINEKLAEGYKYFVEGDYETLCIIDSMSGMPEVHFKTHFFTDLADAEKYAAEQTWPFNNNIHGKVQEVHRRETHEEFEARIVREKEEKKEKQRQKDSAKAKSLGLSYEEYMKYKSLKKRRSSTKSWIKKVNKEIADRQEIVASSKEYLKDLESQIAQIEGKMK